MQKEQARRGFPKRMEEGKVEGNRNKTVLVKRYLAFVCMLALGICAMAQGEIRLAFAGEVNVGNSYGSSASEASTVDASRLFDNVSGELKGADAAFATLGTVLIDVAGTPNRANAIGSHKLIRVSSEYASALAESGLTALNLANAHVSDFGIEGMQTTMNAMRDNGLVFAGLKAMQDYQVFEAEGKKIGFVAFGTAVHTLAMSDSTLIRKIVAGLDDQCDLVVVAFSINETAASLRHGGDYATNRDAYMQHALAFAHVCIDAGADVVFGNGHSQLQPLELYKDRLIMYGLGNFCTPYGASHTGELGAAPLVELTLFGDGTLKEGRIKAFRQRDTRGPHPDASMEAVKVLKARTEAAFPDTELSISDNGDIASTSESVYATAMKLLGEANRYKGKGYRRGTMGPNTFDCSGFTSFIFAKFGIKLDRTSGGQYQQGTKVDRNALQPGDLVFFTGSSTRGVGHVGIVYSVDKQGGSFRFIHASVSKGITIDDFATSPYYIRRYVGAKRVLEKKPEKAAQ